MYKRQILDNIVYRGHTLGLRTTTVSYKNKAEVKRPESEQALVENTHEPLVSQELWEIVREVRRHKRRAPKHMEEPGLFSGLVYCADCGGYLVLCRTEEMREDQYLSRIHISNPSPQCPVGSRIRSVLQDPYDEIFTAMQKKMQAVSYTHLQQLFQKIQKVFSGLWSMPRTPLEYT